MACRLPPHLLIAIAFSILLLSLSVHVASASSSWKHVPDRELLLTTAAMCFARGEMVQVSVYRLDILWKYLFLTALMVSMTIFVVLHYFRDAFQKIFLIFDNVSKNIEKATKSIEKATDEIAQGQKALTDGVNTMMDAVVFAKEVVIKGCNYNRITGNLKISE